MLTNFNLTKNKQFLIGNKRWIVAFLIVVLFILFFFFLLPKSNQPEIVSFDFKNTYATFLKEATKNHLSQEKLSILGKRFPVALSYAVNDYAAKHHAVVLVSGAVMAGAADATPEIQGLIAIEMRKLASKK